MKVSERSRLLVIIFAVTLVVAAVVGARAQLSRPVAQAAHSIEYSIESAVPSAIQHTEDVTRVAPDGEAEARTTENVIQSNVMLRGYCYAASQVKDTKASGFGKSENLARRVPAASQGKGLFLLAQPNAISEFSGKPGMRVVLVNQTSECLVFPASDSRLNIVQEAQDQDGTWRAIEYLPSSWCGNSHHRVCLAPNYYWEFAAPRYEGSLKTKLRFSMTLADESQVYSNIFDGSVHPEQFTIRQGHNPTGIMDPYNE